MGPGNIDNKKQILILIFSVAAGVVAAALVGNYVTNRINEETQRLSLQYEKAQKQKEQQYAEQLKAMQQQISAVEQNAQRAVADAKKSMEEKKAQAATAAPVKKPKPSLALRTPPGKRAITVMVDSLGAVGGLLNPNDFVDVIAHLNIPSKNKQEKKETVTAMIFQRLQVLAINTNLEDNGAYDDQQKERALRITFAVNPEEAGLLAFADKNGKLELTLRAPNESKKQMISAATWATLAEYVLQNQGADIQVGEKPVATEEPEMKVEAKDDDEAKPYIQVYRAGRE